MVWVASGLAKCALRSAVDGLTVSGAWSPAMAMDPGDHATMSATNVAIYLQVTNTGDTIPPTLTFERNGTVSVPVEVHNR
jgi:copper(I)-binding protein